MQTPLHGSRPPFTLPSNVVYFHDWRYVDHGGYRWLNPDGIHRPYFAPGPIPTMRYVYRDMPLGIRLESKAAQRTDPVIQAEPTDIILHTGSLIHDGGRYRLWYDCWPGGHIDRGYCGTHNIVRYAESDDGFHWDMPLIGLIEYEGSVQNNVVFGDPITRPTGYNGGCVFRDPSAPPGERFKSYYYGSVDRQRLIEFRRERPDDVDPFMAESERVPAVFGAVSPDGLHWTPLPDPLLVQTSDTHNICEYDANLGSYVAFVRTWYMDRRSIGRTQTDDFRRFPLPEEVFCPDATQQPYDLWYCNAKTLMPGTIDYHLMFPMRWSLIDDRFEFCLASSPDGIVWSWVPGGPVAKPGPAGTWDGGVVAPGHGLVNLPDKRTGMLVECTPLPHKHPRPPGLGAVGWAWWPQDRLVALRADEMGSFALFPLIFMGRTVHLNVRTTFAGHVLVEAVGPDGEVLPGRSFADCDIISGDDLDRVVSWGGETDLGHNDKDPVTLRFRMRTAELYSVKFV